MVEDADIRITLVENEASVQCGDITITVSGEDARHVSDCAGVFELTEISRGRQLFRNPQTGKYLNFGSTSCPWWGVQSDINSDHAGIKFDRSLSLDMCPASQSHIRQNFIRKIDRVPTLLAMASV